MGSPRSGVHLTYNRSTNLEIHNPQIHLLSAAEAKSDATFLHTCTNTQRGTFKPSLRARRTVLQVGTGDDSPSETQSSHSPYSHTQRGKPRASVDDGSAEKNLTGQKLAGKVAAMTARLFQKWIKGRRGWGGGTVPDSQTNLLSNRDIVYFAGTCLQVP